MPNESFGMLLPLNEIPQTWQGGERLTAVCAAWDDQLDAPFVHEAPDPDCRCGFYALQRLEWVEEPLLHLLADELTRYAAQPKRSPARGQPHEEWLVVGSVHLWGKVIEGTFGYRAQHACPAQLWLLPPARIGGADKSAIGEETVSLAHALLVALRHRYGCAVGYADQDQDVDRLLRLDELGWFFSWRLSTSGSDRFARALGEVGRETWALPTIADALQLWLASRNGGGSWDERRLVRDHLVPAFGQIPVDRSDAIERVEYTPVSGISGKPYVARTVARHRNVLGAALELARARWLVATG